MFTTEDQREEMLALKAKKPAANTATTVFSAPQVINPVGLNVGFRLENSALEAEKKQQEYAEHAAGFAEAAIEKEWWGKTEDATAFWKEASRMDGISKEFGAKAQFFRELSHNPGLLYASPKGAPKPLTKAPSPMFKSSGTAAATQPSGGFGNAQNTKITPIRPMTTPQTATPDGTSPQKISGAGRATASDETALTLEKPNDWNEYLKKSARQVVLGNYTDDVTLGGTLVQIGLGLLGADLPADLRDVYYDWTHLKTTPWYQTLLDTVAILPGVGMIKYADEAATLLKHGDEAVDAVKATGKALDNGDEIIDTVGNVSYNGIKQYSQSELVPADLMDELANSGVKYNPENVVMVTKNYDGQVMWLETGNESAGLKHILDGHTSNFGDMGYNSSEEIQSLLKEILASKPLRTGVKTDGRKTMPYALYSYGEKDYLVAYGTNGYVVSFYPYSND